MLYRLLIYPLPDGISLHQLDKKTAQKHFEWFVDSIPERMEYFTSFLGRNGYDSKLLDYSEQSLQSSWKWFVDRVEFVDRPKAEIKQDKKRYPPGQDANINTKTIERTWRFLMYDFGVYVGECMTHNFEQLHWQMIEKPKNGAYFQHATVGGFNRPFAFAPQEQMLVLCDKLMRGRGKYYLLSGMYKVWTLTETPGNPYSALSSGELLKAMKELNKASESM